MMSLIRVLHGVCVQYTERTLVYVVVGCVLTIIASLMMQLIGSNVILTAVINTYAYM